MVLDLHRENLRLLGMGHSVDVVVGPGDLPVDGEPADRLSPLTGTLEPGDQLEGLRLLFEKNRPPRDATPRKEK